MAALDLAVSEDLPWSRLFLRGLVSLRLRLCRVRESLSRRQAKTRGNYQLEIIITQAGCEQRCRLQISIIANARGVDFVTSILSMVSTLGVRHLKA